jgi:transcription elongation factor GreA
MTPPPTQAPRAGLFFFCEGQDGCYCTGTDMRIPKRRGEQLRKEVEPDRYLTRTKIRQLEDELKDLETRLRREAADETRRLAEMGDLSENAGYQVAKQNLRRINSRILSIKDRLANAIPIDADGSGTVQVGSTVVLEVAGKRFTYEILGSQESNPFRGKISHLSPIGSALVGHKAGDEVVVKTKDVTVAYRVVEVR